ncbi:MAG: HutD family protein [Betaproteobacteria bacterium]
MIRILSPVAYHRQPWKNGGGITTEIAVHPEGAGWDDFQWRVGIAEIAQSGPFSAFPGVDRSIMLLDGAPGSGMSLTIDGTEVELARHEFVDFPGEAGALGTLRGAAVRDFNVMSRRALFTHRRGWSSLAPGQWLHLDGPHWRFVHVSAGAADVVTTVRERRVGAAESLLTEGADTLNLRAGSSGAQLVWGVFTPAAPTQKGATA